MFDHDLKDTVLWHKDGLFSLCVSFLKKSTCIFPNIATDYKFQYSYNFGKSTQVINIFSIILQSLKNSIECSKKFDFSPPKGSLLINSSALWIKTAESRTGVDKLPNLPLIAAGFYGMIKYGWKCLGRSASREWEFTFCSGFTLSAEEGKFLNQEVANV